VAHPSPNLEHLRLSARDHGPGCTELLNMQIRPQSPLRSPHKLSPRCLELGPRAWSEKGRSLLPVNRRISFVSGRIVGEKLFQYPCVFIFDARKLNPVTNLGVAGRDHARGTQHHAIQPKCHRQCRPRRKRKPRLNVTSARTDVAGSCANWDLRSLRAQLQLDGDPASEVSPPFRMIRSRKLVTCTKRNVALLFWEASLAKSESTL
jgi:hypothetical protein